MGNFIAKERTRSDLRRMRLLRPNTMALEWGTVVQLILCTNETDGRLTRRTVKGINMYEANLSHNTRKMRARKSARDTLALRELFFIVVIRPSHTRLFPLLTRTARAIR